MTTAERILNSYIKGDIERDYDESSRKHHTITLESALKAINQALQQSHVSGQLPTPQDIQWKARQLTNTAFNEWWNKQVGDLR